MLSASSRSVEICRRFVAHKRGNHWGNPSGGIFVGHVIIQLRWQQTEVDSEWKEPTNQNRSPFAGSFHSLSNPDANAIAVPEIGKSCRTNS